jgi:hypothetical protein
MIAPGGALFAQPGLPRNLTEPKGRQPFGLVKLLAQCKFEVTGMEGDQGTNNFLFDLLPPSGLRSLCGVPWTTHKTLRPRLYNAARSGLVELGCQVACVDKFNPRMRSQRWP